MKKYFLKPGSYSSSSGLSSGESQGLNLENYIVSVINNPTCCPKNLGGGGGGIEGTMIATATATGTPEENGISAFNAYKSIRDSSYFLTRMPLPGMEIFGDISEIYFQPGLGETDGIIRVNFHSIQTTMTPFAEGKIYALPVGTNRDEYIYGQYISGAVNGEEWFKYVAQPGELSGRIPGFIEREGSLPPGFTGDTIPKPFTFQIEISQAAFGSDQPIYEVELVKPTVLLPPGEYVWPGAVAVGENTMIDSAVNFVGLDKHSTILSDQSNMVIAAGYGFAKIYSPFTGQDYVDKNTPHAQSVVFSNLTYFTDTFTMANFAANGEVASDQANAIIFDNCNIKGSIGNYGGGMSFSFAGFFNCDIYPSVLLQTNSGSGTYYKFEGCNFIGDTGTLGEYGDSIYIAGPGTVVGNNNIESFWSFDSNSGGKNVWLGVGQQNVVEATRTNFLVVLEGKNSLNISPTKPNVWNYVTAGQVNSTGSIASVVNYSAANNGAWPV